MYIYHCALLNEFQSHTPPIPMNLLVFIVPALFQWVSPLPLSTLAGGKEALLGTAWWQQAQIHTS